MPLSIVKWWYLKTWPERHGQLKIRKSTCAWYVPQTLFGKLSIKVMSRLCYLTLDFQNRKTIQLIENI